MIHAHIPLLSSVGYGLDEFVAIGSCAVSVSGAGFVSLKITDPLTFSLASNPFPATVTAGFICERESESNRRPRVLVIPQRPLNRELFTNIKREPSALGGPNSPR